MRKLFYLTLSICYISIIGSCSKFDKNKDDTTKDTANVPYAYVNIKLNIYNELSVVGIGSLVIIQPSSTPGKISIYYPGTNTSNNLTCDGSFTGKSLILYHYNSSPEEWRSYDNTCTYDAVTLKNYDNPTPEQPYGDGTTFFCPTCGTRYLILDGSHTNGPAGFPLKRYNTTVDSKNNVIITN